MSWHPNDLLTDADLRAYEEHILTQFDRADWRARRQKALEDWLFPLLEASGFDPQRFRTRFAPRAVLASTSSVWSDVTADAQAEDGIDVSTVLAAPTDGLYVGFDAPFRGVSVRMLDAVNAAPAAAAVSVWADAWTPAESFANSTHVGMASFARGGAMTWAVPESVVQRSLSTVGPLYWARVRLSATPTAGTSVGPIWVIRRSRLCACVTFRTLALIFREAPISQEGPWAAKAEWYEREAERAWLRAADHIGGEFDTDGDDAISPAEAAQTADAVSGGGWGVERC